MNQARILLALLLFSSGTLFAKAPAAFHYLAPDAIDVTAVLHGPPAAGSPENQDDIQAVLARQQSRTNAEVAHARAEVNLSPLAFDSVIGSWFTSQNLPLTFALLINAASDAEAVSNSGKKFWNRPRPPLQDPSIHAAIPLPSSPSYPSGHSMRGVLWATILEFIVPPRLAAPVLTRGEQIGEDRIIAGVHFPTDVAAGQRLGRLIARRLLLQTPAFQKDLAAAKAEFTAMSARQAHS